MVLSFFVKGAHDKHILCGISMHLDKNGPKAGEIRLLGHRFFSEILSKAHIIGEVSNGMHLCEFG